MRYKKENIIDGIYAKIDSVCPDNGVRRLWKYKLVDYPIEVEQNVLEWINDEPITEIDCHGESIRRVLDYKNLSNDWIPLVLSGFVDFKKSGFTINDHVWNSVYMVADVK